VNSLVIRSSMWSSICQAITNRGSGEKRARHGTCLLAMRMRPAASAHHRHRPRRLDAPTRCSYGSHRRPLRRLDNVTTSATPKISIICQLNILWLLRVYVCSSDPYPGPRHARGLGHANTQVARPEGSNFLSCAMFPSPSTRWGLGLANLRVARPVGSYFSYVCSSFNCLTLVMSIR
jgi:hypothetical protein